MDWAAKGLGWKGQERRDQAKTSSSKRRTGKSKQPEDEVQVLHQQWIERAIEGEILPRLVLMHQQSATSDASQNKSPGQDGPADLIGDFTEIALEQDTPSALAYVAARRLEGMELEEIYLELLAPAARRLGEMWEEDLCDFTAVTIGLGRIHSVLRQIGADEDSQALLFDPAKRILLLPVFGEQHTLGVLMVAEFFRQARWDVWSDPAFEREQLLSLVREQSFPIVGISASADRFLDPLTETIRDIRGASRSPLPKILVGGKVFLEEPTLASKIGADATAEDGRQAVQLAEQILATSAGTARA